MSKNAKRKLRRPEDFGVKIIVLKGPSPYAGKVLFPEKLKVANEVVEKLVDESGELVFKKQKRKQ